MSKTYLPPISMTVPNALKYTGLSRSGFYRAAAQGQIDIRKIGRSSLVMTASLDRFLKSLPTVTSQKQLSASKAADDDA